MYQNEIEQLEQIERIIDLHVGQEWEDANDKTLPNWRRFQGIDSALTHIRQAIGELEQLSALHAADMLS